MKKKQIHWTYILILIYSFSIIGCASDNNDIDKNTSNIQAKRIYSGIDYDFIGEQHNIGLDSIYKKLKKANLTNENDILDFTISGTKSFINNSSDFSTGQKDLVNNIIFSDSIALIKPADSTYLADMKLYMFSHLKYQSSKDYANDVLSAIENINPDSLSTTIDEIKIIEDLIVRDVPSDEIPILLSMCSIARHSSEYWITHGEEWHNTVYGTLGVDDGPGGWTWFKDTINRMILVDTVMGTVGAVIGGVAGAFAGGIGAVPGAIAGAASMGLNASAGAGIMALYDLWTS